jgi:uncharacterized protein YyaL (SSP411 family)
LQHAENPVDWYPWGGEAFAKSREEEKPIFLSVGYSTCHWCHVMEHESFQNVEVAALLNQYFVSVKVDREERPDIDRVYMRFVQVTTGSGGWPMSVWLTPDLKPFFGGTYFQTSSRGGRPGFSDILIEIARLWRKERNGLTASADTLMKRLRQQPKVWSGASSGSRHGVAGPETLTEGVNQFGKAFDVRHGGFGEAPKFPRPSELLFLLREYGRTGNKHAGDMAVYTLRKMAAGGMRDHIGGGFHRYSVDAEWRVPHFEKMLYDQAQLVIAYLEAGQMMNDRALLSVAVDTLDYVARDLTHSEGAFYSAEDADSLAPEMVGKTGAKKTEGAFYLWAADEVDALLGPDAELVRRHYGIEANGNAPCDPAGEFFGKNILHLQHDIEQTARLTKHPVDYVEAVVSKARKRLFDARQPRPRPQLDDKVLTAWNGLLIAAFARASQVLGDDRFLRSAQRAATFARCVLWDSDAQTLYRRFREGRVSIEGYSEDYAFFIWGLLELLQADGNPDWLRWAIELQSRQDGLFWDDAEAGWFSTTGKDSSVLLRLKEDHDGAEPSVNSVSVLNLLTLSHLTRDEGAAVKAERTMSRYGFKLGQAARAMPMMMAALSQLHANNSQVFIVGRKDSQDTRALRERVASHYLPFVRKMPVEPGEVQAQLAKFMPFVAAMEMRNGCATAYICNDSSCQEPITSLDVLDTQLKSLAKGIQ